MTVPTRTCVGCGARAPQPDLQRFVLRGDALAIDGRWRVPGRGAYLHRSPTCADAFVRRRGPVRSLRATPGRSAREALVAELSRAVSEAR